MLPALINLGIGDSLTVTDSVDIQLHDPNAPYAMVSSTRTLLNTIGTACITLSFPPAPIITGDYIAINTRNGIETWSKNPVHISATPAYYDFTKTY